VGQVVTDRPLNEMVCPVIHDASLFFGAGSGGIVMMRPKPRSHIPSMTERHPKVREFAGD
jgi:hypothetical protein